MSKVRALNDLFRGSFIGGQVMLTSAVAGMDEDSRKRLMREVQNFAGFDEGNDPHHEHDFGAIDMNGARFFFRIDYYDPSLQWGSEDPADPSKTRRVLTIMRADEY